MNHRLGMAGVIESPTAARTFPNPSVGVTKGGGLVLGLEGVDSPIPIHHHSLGETSAGSNWTEPSLFPSFH